jgi:MYXO-CTERM domain-containing protein
MKTLKTMTRRAHFALTVELLALATVAFAAPAWADVLPQQNCAQGVIGSRCHNGGSNADQDGICQNATCDQLSYACDAGHAGPCGSRSVACVLCQPVDAGARTAETASSAASAGSASLAAVVAAPVSGASSGKSSGCSASAGGTGPMAGGLLFGVGALLFAAVRRRRGNG